MKDIIAAATLAVVLALSMNDAEAETWSDPTARFTLDFESLDWRVTTPPQGGQHYFAIMSAVAAARRTYLQCTLEANGPLAGSTSVTQAQANRLAERYDVARVSDIVPDARDVSVSHARVDGVAVVDFEFSRPDSQGGTYQHWRTFAVVTDRGLMTHLIICGAAEPVTSLDRAEITSVLNTLRFISEPAR